MKKLILLTASLTILIGFQSVAQYNHGNLKIKTSPEFSNQPEATSDKPEQFDMSYSYENLRFYPIIANNQFREEHKDIGKFTLLKDAIEQNKILISETGAAQLSNQPNINQSSNQGLNGGDVGGTVNTLLAHNNSQDTIFIMAGEVVKGGKQDRVISQDIVLAPDEKVNLSAFCVEKSRWATQDGNKGEFKEYYNVTNMDIRKTVVTENNQSEVWRKVDEQTRKNGASSSTGTYANLENSAEYQEKLAKYMKVFKTAFKNDPNVIGVIAVTGDKVMGCDMFATHDLFISTFENLLHSYIGEAITNGSKVTLGNEEVYNYLDEILKDESVQEKTINEDGMLYKWRNKKLHISRF